MRTRQLGRSGLYVSELALGAMTFGAEEWGCDEPTAVRLIDRYLDAGGNFVDTADGYGISEEILGRALRGRREQVVLATKFGLPTGAGPHDRGASRIHLKRACERSLRRLQTDHIDLYWLHMDDLPTPLEETIAALDELVREGKVLYIGASNLLSYRFMKALAISDRLGAARFIAFQGNYNPIARALEREHFPLFDEEGVGFVSWSPLAAGMLTGKVRPGEATRLEQRHFPADDLHKNERGFEIAGLVQEAAAEVGCTPAQVALAWQRTKPVTSVILGVRTAAQLEDDLSSLEVTLPADVVERIDDATRVPAEYPKAFIDIFRRYVRGG